MSESSSEEGFDARGYGYCRVSTKQQAESGLSLNGQKKEIKKYARRKNIELVKIVSDEGISGRTMTKRPQFVQLLEVLKKGDYLITWSLSRISRSNRDTLNIYDDLKKRGVIFVCIKEKFDLDAETPVGKLMFHVMSSVNDFEAEIISERTKNSMKQAKLEGRAIGRPPYGWKVRDKNVRGSGFVEVEEEQFVISLIVELREENLFHPMGWKSITKYLNEKDIPTPGKSKQWWKNTVKGIYNRGWDVNIGSNPNIYKNS